MIIINISTKHHSTLTVLLLKYLQKLFFFVFKLNLFWIEFGQGSNDPKSSIFNLIKIKFILFKLLMLTVLEVRIIQPSTEHLKVRTEPSEETDLEIFLRFYNFNNIHLFICCALRITVL